MKSSKIAQFASITIMEVKQLAAAIKTKHVFGTDCVPQVSPTKTLFLWLNVENMRGDQKLYSCFLDTGKTEDFR